MLARCVTSIPKRVLKGWLFKVYCKSFISIISFKDCGFWIQKFESTFSSAARWKEKRRLIFEDHFVTKYQFESGNLNELWIISPLTHFMVYSRLSQAATKIGEWMKPTQSWSLSEPRVFSSDWMSNRRSQSFPLSNLDSSWGNQNDLVNWYHYSMSSLAKSDASHLLGVCPS